MTDPMRADLTFIRLMANRPKGDISGGAGNLRVETRPVEIADADALEPNPTLASHGFESTAFAATSPGDGIDEAYAKEFARLCSEAIRKLTGASMVLGFPVSVQVRRGSGTRAEAPITICHSDFTPTSAAQRASNVLSKLGPKGKAQRFAAFNAWWLASDGPQDRPLALCDATSIAPSDLQLGHVQVVSRDHASADYGEIAYQRYSPRHRWYWYPRLGPDRLLVFCGFDSDSSRPSMVTHCAFTNPECPPDAPPRVSVEARCLAFW